MRRERRKSKYRKFLKIYAIVLTVLMIIVIIHVVDSLIKFENNQVNKFLDNTIKDIASSCGKDNCDNLIEGLDAVKKSEFERDDVKVSDGLKELLTNGKVEYKLNKDSNDDTYPVYDVYLNDTLAFQVTLDGSKKENRLSLLSFSEWKRSKVVNKLEKGLYNLTITVPNNYNVYINDKKLDEKNISKTEKNDNLEELSKYASINYLVTYEIDNLFKEPTVKLENKDGLEVDYDIENYRITKKLDYKEIETLEEAEKEIENMPDVLAYAKEWSKFLTNDLTGSLHGYYTIKNYLIDDSELLKYAYKWATGVDITFTSRHVLGNPPFKNESVKNFVIYSDKAFSCEIYFDKVMIINGKEHLDTLNEKIYFANIDGKWKIVNLESITDGE